MLNGKHLPLPHEMIELEGGKSMPIMFFYAVEGASLIEIADGHGYDATFTGYDAADADADGAEEWEAAYEADPAKVLTEWQPAVPEGFTFGGKWHSEDGVQACFLRQRVPA